MFRVVAYLPAFFAACLLALPMGWCCIVPGLAAAPCPMHAGPAQAEQPAKPVRSCCDTKPHHESKPASPQAPAQQTSNCCCDSSAAPLPEIIKVQIDHHFFVALLPVPSVDMAAPVAVVAQALEPPPPAEPLQLVHCVWLC